MSKARPELAVQIARDSSNLSRRSEAEESTTEGIRRP